MRLTKIRWDYYTVYDDAGSELGSVVNRGTPDGEWWAITKGNSWMNPNEAPTVGAGWTPKQAARWLAPEAERSE